MWCARRPSPATASKVGEGLALGQHAACTAGSSSRAVGLQGTAAVQGNSSRVNRSQVLCQDGGLFCIRGRGSVPQRRGNGGLPGCRAEPRHRPCHMRCRLPVSMHHCLPEQPPCLSSLRPGTTHTRHHQSTGWACVSSAVPLRQHPTPDGATNPCLTLDLPAPLLPQASRCATPWVVVPAPAWAPC
jgi:hypothetical protein